MSFFHFVLNPPRSNQNHKRSSSDDPPHYQHMKKARSESSRVVFVRGIPSDCLDSELLALCCPFAVVEKTLLCPHAGQAFVQLPDPASANNLIMFYKTRESSIRGHALTFEFSTRTEIEDTSRPVRPEEGRLSSEQPTIGGGAGAILMVSVTKLQYDMSIDVLEQVFRKFGVVSKIVIFYKDAEFKALVEMQNAEMARGAQEALDRRDIYTGCNTLHVVFSRHVELQVDANTDRTRDFLNPDLPTQEPSQGHHRSSSSSLINARGNDEDNGYRRPRSQERPPPRRAYSYEHPDQQRHAQPRTSMYPQVDHPPRRNHRSRSPDVRPPNSHSRYLEPHHPPGPQDHDSHFRPYEHRPPGAPRMNMYREHQPHSVHDRRPRSRSPPRYDPQYDNNPEDRQRSSSSFRSRSPPRYSRPEYSDYPNARGNNQHHGPVDGGHYDEQPYRRRHDSDTTSFQDRRRRPQPEEPQPRRDYRREKSYDDAKSTSNSPVIICSSLPQELTTPDALFTFFGLFGDVIRVKRMFKKQDTALIQYSYPEHARTAIDLLSDQELFGQKIRCDFSNHTNISLPKPHAASDQDDFIFEQENTRDYSDSPLHRYRSANGRHCRNIVPPCRGIHISGVPRELHGNVEFLTSLFSKHGRVQSLSFFDKDPRMAMADMATLEDAILVLLALDNHQLHNSYMRISFSKTFQRR